MKLVYDTKYQPGQMILTDFAGDSKNLRLLVIMQQEEARKDYYLVYEAWCSIPNQVMFVGTSYKFNFKDCSFVTIIK